MQEHSKKTRPKSYALESVPSKNWLNHIFSTAILQKATLLCELNKKIKAHLSKTINQHCYLIDWTPNEITLGVDAAEWLIHVRQYEQEIKSYLIPHLNTGIMVKIKYLVRPALTNVGIKRAAYAKTSSKISTQNRTIIRNIAQSIKDKGLKASLLKLSGE
jgi:hypothetical protein